MRAGVELAQGDLQYYRLGYQHQWFYPLTRIYTLMLKGDIGYAAGIGERPVPFFKAYFAGGPDTVRGYRAFSLGPRDINNNAIGGNTKLVGSAELLFPMPGATAEQSLRLAAFVDAGQVYAEGAKVELSELRYSTGLALQWLSPFGPLRLSIAHPLNRKAGDEAQRLQFTFGTGF
jgi:outer membrane protein insertion porin family